MTATESAPIQNKAAFLDKHRTWWSFEDCRDYLVMQTGYELALATLKNYASRGFFRKSPTMPIVDRASFQTWVSNGCPNPAHKGQKRSRRTVAA